MIDSHCHLTDRRLFPHATDVIRRADGAGVTRMVTIGTTIDDARACIDLCRAYPTRLRCAIGIQPHDASPETLAQVPLLRELQADPSVVALGEMGLEYHYDFSPRGDQRLVFEAQLQLAGELNRPVVIHCREAIDECLAILASHPRVPAVFHCFTGTLGEAKRILAAGYLLSFTGVITFKNSNWLREVVAYTPVDRLLVETDSPYLAPEPFRKQKVNEPALVIHTAAEVGRIKGLPPDEIDRATTQNALAFFRWT